MDVIIIAYLFEGKTQAEISVELKKRGMTPNSLSYIEKTLKKIRERYQANTMFHLAAILSKIKN